MQKLSYPRSLSLLVTFVLLFSFNGIFGQHFYEETGEIAIEAEDYITSAAGTDSREWLIVNDDASGGQAVFTEDWGDNQNTPGDGARLDYPVYFENSGFYYLYVLTRAKDNDGGNDSFHAGMDESSESTITSGLRNKDYTWVNTGAFFNVSTTGSHTLNIWMREDGLYIDKIVLSTNPTAEFSFNGPDATPPIDSTAMEITRFEFNGIKFPVAGQINGLDIQVDVPHGTDVANLIPTIDAPYGASVSPPSGNAQDFSNPFEYTVSALDGSSQIYTVTVTELPVATGNEVTSLYMRQLEQFAVIDNTVNTITFDYLKGYTENQEVTIELSQFATATLTTGSYIDPNNPPQAITVTAQNGDTREYDVIANEIEGVRGFRDEFATNEHADMWPDDGVHHFIWNENNQQLDYTKDEGGKWARITLNFPEELNLYGVPLIKMALTPTMPLNNPGIRIYLVDAEGNKNTAQNATRNYSLRTLFPGQTYYETWDFSLDDRYLNTSSGIVDLGHITALEIEINVGNNGGAATGFVLDNFYVGEEALTNHAPTVNPVPSPDWVYVSDIAENTIDITGISDGNPERDETMTITVTSSNPAVVSDFDISYDGVNDSAQITYTPNGTAGIAKVTVTVKDNKGRVYENEMDSVSTSFLVQVRDPNINNAPSYSSTTSKIHVTTGQNILILPNVDDGDEDKEQELTFEITSQSPDLLVIDSVNYNPANKIALIYATEQGAAGTVGVDVTIRDNGGTENNAVDSISGSFTVTILGFTQTGMNWEGYMDVAQWQPMPYRQTPNISWSEIFETSEAEGPGQLYWNKGYGWIVPPETGDYIFEVAGSEPKFFYLSTDHQPDNLADMCEATAYDASGSLPPNCYSEKEIVPSDPITLQAGKYYYYEFYVDEVVFGFKSRFVWTVPGTTEKRVLSGNELIRELDVELPSSPLVIDTIIGVNDITLSWSTSTDNKGIDGYNVYLDGIKVNESNLKTNTYKTTGLKSETKYSLVIRSVDNSGNESNIEEIITLITYPEDNNPPTVPQNITQLDQSGMSVKIGWDASSDAETQIRGYNVYLNGNTAPANGNHVITGTDYWVTSLDQESDYEITVTAVDAGYNESAPSNPGITASTGKFCATCTEDGIKRARVSFSLEPVSMSPGMGINQGRVIFSNQMQHGYFEDPAFVDASGNVLDSLNKSTANGMNFSVVSDNNVYAGKQSAMLKGTSGSRLRNDFNSKINQEHTYLVKFAMKKAPEYDGKVNIKIHYHVGTIATFEVSPTDEWKEYELTFTPTGYNNVSSNWWMDFTLTGIGAVYLDNLEFHDQEYYIPGSRFSQLGIDLVQELGAIGPRHGGVGQGTNGQSLDGMTGPYPYGQNYTYADMVAFGNMYCNGYSSIVIGVDDHTDFFQNPTTFSNLIEYLAGPAGTEWGDKRIAEGYDNLMTDSTQVMIELGCEVWGGSHGIAPRIYEDRAFYGNWARNMIKTMKSSPYFEKDKFRFMLSEDPIHDNNNKKMLEGHDIKNDPKYWTSGGARYIHSNTAIPDDANITVEENHLNYLKDAWKILPDEWYRTEHFHERAIKYTGDYMPLFGYEGNFSPTNYNGRVGQAVMFTDYVASMYEHGCPEFYLFHLTGGNWKLTEPDNNYKRRPQYEAGHLFNKFCKGTILETAVETNEILTKANGNDIGIPPVGAYAYSKNKKYSMMLSGRDFEKDFVVQIDLPDEVSNISTQARLVTFTANHFDDYDAIITENIINFKDSLIISVPKYSLVFVDFTGDDMNIPEVPAGNFEYQKITSISLTGDTEANEPKARLSFNATIEPEDAFVKEVKWETIDMNPCQIFAGFTLSAGIYAKCNDTLTVRAYSPTDLSIYDELTVTITNQETDIDQVDNQKVKIYPNPVSNYLTIELNQEKYTQLKVINYMGKIIKTQQLNNQYQKIDFSGFAAGMYIIELRGDKEVAQFKILKN